MKKHDYLDLKIGCIEQYSMIIKKKHLVYWQESGWLAYTEINLPEGDEEADMLYGEFNKHTETLIFNRPKQLKNQAEQTIKARSILAVSTNLGTYGMGGPGFFGLLLDQKEYLVYATWSAADYVLVDNRVVNCHPDFYHKTRPWISSYGEDMTWDELSNYLLSSLIFNCQLTDDRCLLTLKKGSKTITIDFVKNDPRLPRKTGRKKNAYSKGKISDYLLFQHQDALLIV